MEKSLTDEQCQRIVDELNKKDYHLRWHVYKPKDIMVGSAFIALEVYESLDHIWKHKFHLGKSHPSANAGATITIGNNFGFDIKAVAFAYIDLPDIDIGSHLM